jgi:acetylornithine deacetylase/succinyl-diaminopimelate desuccinylase-like protein
MRWILILMLFLGSPAAAAPRDWVAAHRVELLREYLELLAIPNVASDRPNIRRNAEHIAQMMARRGLSPRLLESEDGQAPPLIYGEWRVPGATRTYILYAHYDGQPVTPADDLVSTLKIISISLVIVGVIGLQLSGAAR